MKITEVISKSTIAIGLDATSKQDLLEKMTELVSLSGKVRNKSAVLKHIIDREKVMSTGIGKNISLPHAKLPSIDEPVGAIAVLKKPIDFQSLDGEPISICFLLLGIENNVGLHLRLLSKISRLLNNDAFRANVINCKTAGELFSLFEQAEESSV